MQLLRKRAFWVWVGLAGVAIVTLVVYWSNPPANVFSYVFDFAGFVALYLGGLITMSQFVLPVQTTADRKRVLEHFLQYGFGGRSPIVFVKDGKLVARKEELKLEGNGVALLDPSSALVLQRESAPPGQPLARAVGPGVAFLREGEKIVAALDLRKQSRGLAVKALSKDGIEVNATVSVTFALSLDPPRSNTPAATATQAAAARNRPARLFDADRAFRAVYGAALGEKQPIPWTELPGQVAAEIFRNLMAGYSLDQLFPPLLANPDDFPLDELQAALRKRVTESPVLKERGLTIFGIAVSAPRLPAEVAEQRVRLWQARWQRAALQQRAADGQQAVRVLGRWRTMAQRQILSNLQSAFASSPAHSKKSLALILARTLQDAARNPHTLKLLSQDQLNTVEKLQDWLK